MKEEYLRYIKGIGPRKEAAFKAAGIYTVFDLLYYFPFRYEDRRYLSEISGLKVNEFSVVKGRVCVRDFKRIPYFRSKRAVKSIFKVILQDSTGSIKCSWFNQAYLSDVIKVGSELVVYGKPVLFKGELQIVSPEYEIIKEKKCLNMGRIVGVYRAPFKFSQRFIRNTVSFLLKKYLPDYTDPIPFYIRKEKNIPNIAKSLEEMHFPSSWEDAESARERFIFEELFFSQILVYLRKAKHRLSEGAVFGINFAMIDRIKKSLPFALTEAQENVLSHILEDLTKPYPMHRLLQGDVGCGKTVVAAFAVAACLQSGWQAAFMVPTEILAYQHKETLEKILKVVEPVFPYGPKVMIKVATSSLSKKELTGIYAELENGNIGVIVGTHSLIQEKVKFKKLGLVIIDEQHKFGVAQRDLLPKKGKISPNYLVMSATPIPRSLALSLYGDLDLSVIKQLPQGRIPARTIWLKEDERQRAYDLLRDKLKEGRQAYIVYPVIEESENFDLKSLKSMYDKIVKMFSDFSVAMFHGQMKNDDKVKVIKDFRDKKINILVATTVVEVGVNVENAAVMVIESPERFGLAQLHQLRGRIQRSEYQPYFIVISSKELSPNASKRLQIISQENCGFKISEEDLALRGPGDFFGNLQHGLPDLKIANPLRDLKILQEARSFAYRVIKNDCSLSKPLHKCIRDHLDMQF